MVHDVRHAPQRECRPRRLVVAGLLALVAVLTACTTATPVVPVPASGAAPTPPSLEASRTPGIPSVAPPPSPSASRGGAAAPSPGMSGPLPGPTGAPTPVPSPGLQPGYDAETVAALQRTMDRIRTVVPVPGIQVSVRSTDGRAWSGASGLAVIEPPRLVSPRTGFAIASITKTFVAALILQLVDAGRLSLDDTLDRFLPDFRRANRITIRMLLNHTSGIDNYFENPKYNRQVFRDTSRRWTFDEILGFVRGGYFPPGEDFHYSNTNFVILGRIAEEVTRAPLHEELRRRFFDPLGLRDTYFQPEERSPETAHAHLAYSGGYYDHTRGSRVVPHMSAATVAWAAGAIASTASDIGRWAEALYGGSILSPASTAEMMAYDPRTEYGLGMRMRLFEGRRGFGHTGGIRGFTSAMWHFPREGWTITVVMNRGLIGADRPIRMLIGTLERRLGAPPPEVPQPAPPPTPTPSGTSPLPSQTPSASASP